MDSVQIGSLNNSTYSTPNPSRKETKDSAAYVKHAYFEEGFSPKEKKKKPASSVQKQNTFKSASVDRMTQSQTTLPKEPNPYKNLMTSAYSYGKENNNLKPYLNNY